MVVLNDDVSTWPGPAVHLAKRCNRVANEQKRKPREGQVEQRAADLINGLNICFDEVISTCTCRPPPPDGLTSGFAVPVQSGHFARRADEFAHQPHALAGAASDIQASPARPQPDRLKDSARRRLKHLRLTPKPLILVARMPEHIVVAHRGDQLLASLKSPRRQLRACGRGGLVWGVIAFSRSIAAVGAIAGIRGTGRPCRPE